MDSRCRIKISVVSCRPWRALLSPMILDQVVVVFTVEVFAVLSGGYKAQTSPSGSEEYSQPVGLVKSCLR